MLIMNVRFFRLTCQAVCSPGLKPFCFTPSSAMSVFDLLTAASTKLSSGECTESGEEFKLLILISGMHETQSLMTPIRKDHRAAGHLPESRRE